MSVASVRSADSAPFGAELNWRTKHATDKRWAALQSLHDMPCVLPLVTMHHGVRQFMVMQVANDTIIMLIGLVYCVIQPIIAPLALIYFGIGVLIWKYQVVYVYVPLVESGGKVCLHRHGNSLSCVCVCC